MEINIARDGIRNTDEVIALIYFGRYEVQTWAELYYAAVKTLYIEYPEVINSLVSKDPNRALYLRTTTIDMKQPVRISTILYLDVSRTPEQIVKALREIFRNAGVVNINMSIEIRRTNNAPTVITKVEPNEIIPQVPSVATSSSFSSIPIPKTTAQYNFSKPTPTLEVPSFMQTASDSIRKLSEKERYIEQMKYLASRYPELLKREAGKFLNNRRVTLAETGYRYFIEEVEIGAGLSIEVNFTDESLRENADHYLKIAMDSKVNR